MTAPQTCPTCAHALRPGDSVPAAAVGARLGDYLKGELGWDGQSRLCKPCLLRARTDHLLSRLKAERGALSAVEAEVAVKAASHESIADDLERRYSGSKTYGERAADAVARVGGSWRFVIAMMSVLVLWILLNAALGGSAFDPFPFILLNLVLSCIAALQAPIIMMSQNRASLHDRSQADQDFRINLKAELEIAALHEKIDHLLHEQWDRLIDLQQLQIEQLQEITDLARSTRKA